MMEANTSPDAIARVQLLDREYWRDRQDDLRGAALAVSGALSLGSPPGNTAEAFGAERGLDFETQRRLAALTGNDAVLEWIVVAASTALTLRRLGCGRRVVLATGTPLVADRHGVPVDLELRPDDRFRDLLDATRRATLEALAHDRPPAPILDACFGDAPVVEVRHPVLHRADARARALTIAFVPGSRVIASSAGEIETRWLQVIADAIASVMEHGLNAPDTRVACIGLLHGQARQEVLAGLGTSPELAPSPSFLDQVMTCAAERPDALALRDHSGQLTYSELCRAAVAIARRLHRAGVGVDDVVALAAPRSARFVATAVGILFSGAAYLPIDPGTPSLRLRELLVRARAWIADDAVPAVDGAPCPRLSLAELWHDHALPGQGGYELVAPPRESLAYAIFTSGSTGAPKCASVQHGSFLNLLAFRADSLGLGPGVALPQTAPVTFDVSIWQMFAGLIRGATIAIVPDPIVRDPADLIDHMLEHGYPVVELVPSLLGLVIDELSTRPHDAARLRDQLRAVIATGELLGVELARRWSMLMPGTLLLNAYGPAECADDATEGPARADDDGGAYTSIGRPLPGARVYVVDEDLQPVPAGVSGQICIGGVGVGRGYLGEPALTAVAFVPDPFDPAPGRRMYLTGDRGQWRPDGTLECLGRSDTQVKIRGRRVELGEIEHVLETAPGVDKAVVELIADGVAERLVAFVTRRPDSSADARALEDFAAGRLQAHAVPREIVLLDRLPCSRNGKVDRRALRDLAARRRAGEGAGTSEYVAPRNDIERMFCDIWAKLLELPRVGIRDDFFTLGGDSIVIIRFVHAAARRGVTIRPGHVYEHHTIEALAALARCPEPEESVGAGSTIAPLAPIQRWFFEQRFMENDHWNQSHCVQTREPLSPEVLDRALRELSSRHEQLRARFLSTPAGVEQEIGPISGDLLWRARRRADGHYELLDGTGRAGPVEAIADELHCSLSLGTGQVFRALLIEDSPSEHRLLLTAHHLVVDHVSWMILLDDLESLYRALSAGEEARLAPPSARFTAWARRCQALAENVIDDAFLEPFSTKAPVVSLPVDASCPNIVAAARVAEVELPRHVTARALARAAMETEEGAQAMLLAAVARAFADAIAPGRILIELEGHGRQDEDLDVSRTVGWFTVLGVLQLDTARQDDPALATRAVARTLAKVRPRLSRYMVARHLRRDPRLTAMPDPEVGLNYLGRTDAGKGDGDRLFAPASDLGNVRSSRGHRALEWEMNAGIVDGRLLIRLEFVPGRHRTDQVQAFLTACQAFIEDLAAAGSPVPDIPEVDELVPLTPAQSAFFARGLPRPDHWNHGVLLTARQPLDMERLLAAVHILAERHPALRARFVVTPQGVRQGAVTGPDAAPPVSRFEVADDRAVDQLATRLHRGIDLARGPIAWVALLVFPGERPEQVLLIVHHAVMDPYSWNVLLEELTALLEHDDAAALGPPSTSYLEWARRLAAYVRHHPDRLTPDYWLSQDRKSVSIPLDNPQAPGLEGAAACLTTELTAAQTHALRALARDSHATLFEHALAALGAGVQRWLGLEDPAAPGLDRRDAGAVLIAVSGHGREDLIPGLDLSRTIGWFTTSSPFHLPLPGQQDAGEHTARVVQAWRDVPGRGIDHGLLCHLHPDEDLRRRARAALAPAIAFDWHGERDMLATPHGEERPILFGAVTGGTGQWKDPDAPRAHVLDIMASVTEGRLVVEWHFSGDRIRRERIARLAEFFTEELCQRLG